MRLTFPSLFPRSLFMWLIIRLASGILMMTGVVNAQEVAPAGRNVLSTDGVHPAVLRAAVLREQVVKGGAESGGDLIIQRIAEPVLTAEELAAANPPPARVLTALEKAVRLEALKVLKATQPRETRLFSPEVTVYPDGVALVRWWSVDAARNFQTHGVWTSGVDFSLLPAVNDLRSGQRRWLVMAGAVRAVSASAAGPQPPSPEEFAASAGTPAGPVVLVEEGGGNPEDLEPLTALLAELKTHAPQLAEVLAARKAAQEREAEEAAARAKLPPPPSVIRFWTSDADEVSTFAKSLPENGGGRK